MAAMRCRQPLLCRPNSFHQPIMTTIAHNIQQVRDRIEASCVACGRSAQSVTLVAVSKTVTAADVQQAIDQGLSQFGENYVQEGVSKIEVLHPQHPGLTWHMIGPLQNNKTKAVAEHFDWCHTLTQLHHAQRLSRQRPGHLEDLQVCLQVNLSGEASKSGVEPRAALELAREISRLPRLRLRGLMSIPEPTPDGVAQRRAHRALRVLLEDLRAQGLPMDTLSMGMSADLEAAIEEGATHVRIGTAIFGARRTP